LELTLSSHFFSILVQFLAIYGRFNNPDAEYYIVENHIPFNPPPSWKTTGTLETGDGVYTLYESWLPPSPRLLWAIRVEKRNSGVVKLTDFFDAWRLVGVNLGNHRQVIVAIMGSSSSGQARVYSLTR
jgi:endo-1,4-beta-xylanase